MTNSETGDVQHGRTRAIYPPKPLIIGRKMRIRDVRMLAQQ